MNSVFHEDSFSKKAKDLYKKSTSETRTQKYLRVIANYDNLMESHSRGVAHIISEFCTSGAIDVDDDEKENFVRVAALHDLGKLSISRLILDKPGNLSKKEWQSIEYHSIDGFNRYALAFDAHEALPILIHHTMQPRYYPRLEDVEKSAAVFDIDLAEISDENILRKTAAIAIADNLEARFPITDLEHPSIHIRKYGGRRYAVDELPGLVRASFVESGKIKKLGLVGLMDDLLSLSQETFLKKQKQTNPET